MTITGNEGDDFAAVDDDGATQFAIADLAAWAIEDIQRRKGGLHHGRRWGPWQLDTDRFCLCWMGGEPERQLYEIDLEEIPDPKWIVDWIAQIIGKSWGTPEVLGHLVMAFDHLFDPRATIYHDTSEPMVDRMRRLVRAANA